MPIASSFNFVRCCLPFRSLVHFVLHETHILYTCTSSVANNVVAVSDAVIGAAAILHLCPLHCAPSLFLLFFLVLVFIYLFFCSTLFSPARSLFSYQIGIMCKSMYLVFFSSTFISFKYSSIFGKDFCPLQFGW